MASMTTAKLQAFAKGQMLDGYPILTILGRNDDFLVCSVDHSPGVSVRWTTIDTVNFTESQHAQIAAFNERYDTIKETFGSSARGPIESLASALYSGLCRPDTATAEIFRPIDTRVVNAIAQRALTSRKRMLYAVSALSTCVSLFLLCAALWIATPPKTPINGITSSSLLLSVICGSTGALASVLQKLRHLEVEFFSDTYHTIFGGASRVILGAIFGVFALLGAHGGLLLSALLKVDGGNMLIAIAAGISERLVPEMFSSIEKGSPST